MEAPVAELVGEFVREVRVDADNGDGDVLLQALVDDFQSSSAMSKRDMGRLLEKDSDGEAHITRRVWFDRSVENAPLTRQQFFEGGEVVTEVTYSSFFEVSGHRLPKKIFVRRPIDRYAVTITLKPESVQVDTDVPPTAFILNNDDGLPETNLDTLIKIPPAPKKPKGE